MPDSNPSRPPRKPVRYWLREPLAAVLLRAFSWLGPQTCFRIGRLVGWLSYRTHSRARRITAKNLAIYQRFKGDISDKQCAILNLRSLQHTATAFLELGLLWQWPKERVTRLITDVDGEEHVHAALDQQKGLIFVTPHLGCWEMTGIYVASNFQLTTMYKPHRIERVSQVMKHGRERFGGQYVPTSNAGIARMIKTLRQGGSIGLLPDQDPSYDSGVFAPLFGLPANTATLMMGLAAKTGSPVLACYTERLQGGRYRVVFRPAIEIAELDTEAAAAKVNREIEQVISACPEQYLWSYPRYKRRPDPKEIFY